MNRREHYEEAERLLAKAEKMLDDALMGRGAMAGARESTAHAVLANAYALANAHAALAGVDPEVAGERPSTPVGYA